MQTIQSQSHTFHGFVVDEKSGERLIGCNVLIQENLNGTSTDGNGFFSLDVPAENAVHVVFSYIGYAKMIYRSDSIKDSEVVIALKPDSEIPEVSITRSTITGTDLASKIRIDPSIIRKTPAFLGERDLLRLILLKPGVQSGREGSSGLIVRGGSPDQNLFLVDGVPTYYIHHIGNILSTFNADALNSVEFYKAGFPARFGGRLSSITDIRLKDGNQKKRSGAVSLGTLAVSGTLGGPIGDKTSYMMSARRCNLDLITRVISLMDSDGKGMAGYTFFDASLKVKHRINSRNYLYFTTFANRDRLFLKFWEKDDDKANRNYRSELVWSNYFSSIRLNHIYNQKNIADLSFSYSLFNYRNLIDLTIDEELSETVQTRSDLGTSINEIIVRYDHNYNLSNNLVFRFGSEYIYHGYNPYVNQEISETGFGIYQMPELNTYLEAFVTPLNRVNVNVGMRHSVFWEQGIAKNQMKPRIAIKYKAIPSLDFRLSYSRMSQNVHLVTNSSGGIPVDMWIPAIHEVPGEVSNQISIGTEYKLGMNKKYLILIEGYIKKQENLVDLLPGCSVFDVLDSPTETLAMNGSSRIAGFELSLKKESGRTSGWISYMYIKNRRTFDDLNGGDAFPYVYEKPHNLYAVSIFKVNDHIDLSITWQFTSGNPQNLPIMQYAVPVIYDQENPILGNAHIYGPRNSIRIKPYHRMDFSIDFRKKLKRSARTFNISIVNVYNRQNPFFYFYLNNEDGQNVLHQLCLFPIMPSISYRLDF